MNYFFKAIFTFYLVVFAFDFSFAQTVYSSKSKKAIKYYEEATKFYDIRDRENAKLSLIKSIEQDNLFVEAHMLLSYIYSDLKQAEKAVEEMKKALEINPTFFHGNYFTLAQLQIAVGSYKEAKENYVKFLQKPFENKEMVQKAEMGIVNCDFAVAALDNP